MKKEFKFSVIIPIFNVEDYLEETIESVINQTIGFEENIQLILINDGSPDNSEKICLKYKELYPENVIYYKQKNAGVSAARNKGIELAEGEYVNFLDSDDKWSLDTFKEVYKNNKKNPEINIFSCKMMFFDAQKGNHPLNYKYKENKIVDITVDDNYVQMHASPTIIKTAVAKKYKFDQTIKYAEDTKFINEILLDEKKMLLLKEPTYYYRKRSAGNSAIQTKEKNKDWYQVSPTKVFKYIIEKSLEKYGKVLPFVQYTIMYELQWRFKTELKNDILTKKEANEYKEVLYDLLSYIEDSIILKQKKLFIEHKLFLISKKNKQNILKKCSVKDDKLIYNDMVLVDFKKSNLLTINVINLKENIIDICGQLNCLLPEKDYEIIYEINDKEKKLKLEASKRNTRIILDEVILNNKTFRFKENLKDLENKITFYIEYKGNKIKLSPAYTFQGRIDKKLSLHFLKNNKMIYNQKGSIIINKKSIIKCLVLETKCFLQMLKNKKIKQMIYRYTAKLFRLFNRKEIWLISDRTLVANDNGMHFFKYTCKQNDKNIKPYFVIDKSSEDYNKMKEYGRVVAHNSYKYKVLFLAAKKIISSQGDAWVINAFGKNEKFYRDMFEYDFVFLQHGITKNDQTAWLNYMNKNIKMLVTATIPEYESFLDLNYGYTKDEIKLTGFPRYDNLVNEREKLIAVMPTWRQSLSGINDGSTGVRQYNPDFKKSEYFKFYNDLINDKELLSLMKKKGYKGIFVTHPSHMTNSIDFEENECFEVVKGYADYQEIFKKASLLITDYSSVAFDFAYLKKPVIYAEFDKEEFFKQHIYDEGYFKTERDGFGPVVKSREEAIKSILEALEKDCEIENKYKKRIEKFYKFNDTNNCKRVYEEIKKIK